MCEHRYSGSFGIVVVLQDTYVVQEKKIYFLGYAKFNKITSGNLIFTARKMIVKHTASSSIKL